MIEMIVNMTEDLKERKSIYRCSGAITMMLNKTPTYEKIVSGLGSALYAVYGIKASFKNNSR